MPPTPSQENARFVFLVILILWLNAGTDTGPALLSAPALILARLQRQREAHGILNTTKWGDFAPRQENDPKGTAPRYLNLTGFREEDSYAWEDLGRFRQRCLEWSRNAHSSAEGRNLWDLGVAEPTWQNATGSVHGRWVRHPGSVTRDTSTYNLTGITPDVAWIGGQHEWGRNISGAEGKIIVRLDDKDTRLEYEDQHAEGQPRSGGVVREVAASVTLEDSMGSGSTHDMRLHGVHWPRQGTMLLTTTSEKFAGIFGLPHLTPGSDFFQSSQKILNQSLDEVLQRKEQTRFSDPSNPWSANPDTPQESWNPSPHCEYIMYVQVHPLQPQQLGSKYLGPAANEILAGLVNEIEEELRNPTGAPIHAIPELQMSVILHSPDCAFFLESKGPPLYTPAEGQHLVGSKEEVFLYGAKLWLLAFAAVVFAQVQLLQKQMRESYTPSTLGRISFWTVSMMLLADGLTFAASSAWSLSASTTFLPSLMVTFAAFLAMTIGGSFLAEVYKVQEPERRNREREQSSNGNTPRPPSTPANIAPPTGDSLPRPVTAPPPRSDTPPIIIPSDQDIAAEIAQNTAASGAAIPRPGVNPANATTTPAATSFSTIAGRFIILGAFILFLSLAATSWWPSLRAAYTNTLAFLYLSLWVPQIFRNIQRNSRRAFSWRFMIGQSALRILPLAYFYLREDNIFYAQSDWYAFTVLAGWLWIQLWILGFQDVLGPRFGIPAKWTPHAWDYHPVLREDNIEAGGLPIGLVSTSVPGSPTLERIRSLSQGETDRGRERDKDRKRSQTRTIDCAICREVLEVPVVKAGEDDPTGGGVAGVFARRQYMVTPCRHIFHSPCLEGWLRFRLQCPICREDLPPL